MSCPVISSRNGKISGKVLKLKCKEEKLVYVYRNIPFGKAPVGNLRFMPPQPADPWQGVRDGTVVGKMAMQSNETTKLLKKMLPLKLSTEEELLMDEDCLHLSIYTPDTTKGRKLPVMVWFYGGGFQTGSEAYYGGSALAGMNDVIVVVPNYRVGIFGFLSLGASSICPGNAGLLDQQLSLKWVRDNIETFGGDKENVTIFGESAGACAVSLHAISPLARGLFHKAITHSGQAVTAGLLPSEHQISAFNKRLLESLGITEKDDVKVLEALQNIPALDLTKVTFELEKENIAFTPNLDGIVLPKSPDQALKDGNFAKIPHIVGCNNTEGSGMLAMIMAPGFLDGLTEKGARDGLRFPLCDETFNLLKEFYVKDKNDPMRFSKFFGQAFGDAMFVVPTLVTASAYSQAGSDVFLYYGAFQLRMNHDDKYGKEVTKKLDWCVCDHGDELQMIFGNPFTPGDLPYGAQFSDDEVKLSRQCMTYITNFAKHGH